MPQDAGRPHTQHKVDKGLDWCAPRDCLQWQTTLCNGRRERFGPTPMYASITHTYARRPPTKAYHHTITRYCLEGKAV